MRSNASLGSDVHWHVLLKPAAKRALARFDRTVQARILDALDRLAASDNPRQSGRVLVGHPDLWRFRVGDYRIIAQLKDAEWTVLVLKTGHRRDVYRALPG